jgi:hypothetical protein
MPSAPKKTTKKNAALSPEEHALLLKTRREAIEKRLLLLQSKMEKDRALLKKYAPLEEDESVSGECKDQALPKTLEEEDESVCGECDH